MNTLLIVSGYPKGQYAAGYFSEMGIGTRRDPLDANAWYVKAADQGDERAKHRLIAIHSAASGGAEEAQVPPSANDSSKKGNTSKPPAVRHSKDEESTQESTTTKDGGETKEKSKKKWGIF